MKVVVHTSTHLQLLHRPFGIEYLFGLLGGTVTCDFYKSLNVMTLTRQGLLGRTIVEYPLHEITAIEVAESRNKLFILEYRIRLKMKSQVLYLNSEPLYTYGEAGNIGTLISQFLNINFNYLPTFR